MAGACSLGRIGPGAEQPDSCHTSAVSAAYAVVYLRRPGQAWPADIGDDPALMAAAQSESGVITWGICRRNLRNLVRAGDVLVFFAADRLTDHTPASYCWVGYATVDRKISQAEIWEKNELADFRTYPN